MSLAKILWVDDEIESLQSQKKFLQNKGYDVQTLTNGFDAIDWVKENAVDVVLIDESMPGITGLETLAKIKEINAQIPVVLITKNETENLMDEAIGSQISDYLIKPVNPNQVWLSLKKIQTIRNGWEFTRNWCIGNSLCNAVTAPKCRKFFKARRTKPTRSFSNLFPAIMRRG